MRAFLLATALGLAACAPAAEPGPPAPDTLRVMLRVDDVFMNDTDVQPQEIDSFLVAAERFGAKVELSVIPQRLVAPRNADGVMAERLRTYVARGHDVSQHGWTHRNARTGDTSSEFYDPATSTWSPPGTVLARLARGKRLLEAAVGVPVIRYVSPGRDPQLAPESLAAMRALGVRWLTHDSLRAPRVTDSLRYVPTAPDYTWGLTDSTYAAALAAAQRDVQRARTDGFFLAIFHDHFTRYAWHEGLTARWLSDLLAWIEAQPDLVVEYVSVRDLDAEWDARSP